MFCLLRNSSVSQAKSGSRATSPSLGTLQVSSYQGVQRRGDFTSPPECGWGGECGAGGNIFYSAINLSGMGENADTSKLQLLWEKSTRTTKKKENKERKLPTGPWAGHFSNSRRCRTTKRPAAGAAGCCWKGEYLLRNSSMQVKRERKQVLTSQQIPACRTANSLHSASEGLLREEVCEEPITYPSGMGLSLTSSSFYCRSKTPITMVCVPRVTELWTWDVKFFLRVILCCKSPLYIPLSTRVVPVEKSSVCTHYDKNNQIWMTKACV